MIKCFYPLVFTLFHCFLTQKLLAQSATPDKIPELEKQLAAETDDSKKAFLCNELAFAYNKKDRAKALEFGEKALGLARETKISEEQVKACITISKIYMGQSNLAEAQKSALEALEISKKTNNRKGEGGSLNELGNIAVGNNDRPEALKHYNAALKIRQELNDLEGTAGTFGNMGNVYEDLADLTNAEKCFLQALEIKEKLGNEGSLAITLRALGNHYFKWGSDLKKAETYLLRAMKLYEKSQSLVGQSGVYVSLGKLYYIQKDMTSSNEYFFKALPIAEKLNDPALKSNIYHGLSLNFYELGDYETALSYNLKLENIASSTNNKALLMHSQTLFGNLATAKREYAKAEAHYDKAIELGKSINDELFLPEIFGHKAFTVVEQGNSTAALPIFDEAIRASLKISSTNLTAGVNFVEKGKALRILNRFEEALASMQNGLLIFQKMKAKSWEAFALKEIARAQRFQSLHQLKQSKITVEKAMGLVDSASAKHISEIKKEYSEILLTFNEREAAEQSIEEVNRIRDTLWNQEKATTMTAMELNNKFSLEKAAAQLEQEKKESLQKAEIARRNSWLQVLGVSLLSLILLGAGGFQFLKNRQKLQATKLENQVVRSELTALRAQLNPHFLFNSLNSIGQFIEKKDPARARDYLAEFARLMRSTLDQSGQALIPLSEEIETLRRYLSLEALRFRHPFDFEVTAAADLDDFDTQIPPMLVQPFVENAVWHGLSPKNEAGRVQVFFKKENGKLVCTVEDDGVGREAGSKNSDHESAGMKIIRERLDLLARQTGKSADFEIFDLKNSDGQNSGTRVEISFAT